MAFQSQYPHWRHWQGRNLRFYASGPDTGWWQLCPLCCNARPKNATSLSEIPLDEMAVPTQLHDEGIPFHSKLGAFIIMKLLDLYSCDHLILSFLSFCQSILLCYSDKLYCSWYTESDLAFQDKFHFAVMQHGFRCCFCIHLLFSWRVHGLFAGKNCVFTPKVLLDFLFHLQLVLFVSV